MHFRMEEKMSKTQPIKDEEMLKKFRNYYRDIEPNPRNYALIVFGLNSALRISDILGLCWNDVYSDQNHRYREHIAVWEQKTGKENILIVNQHAKEAFKLFSRAFRRYECNILKRSQYESTLASFFPILFKILQITLSNPLYFDEYK